MIWAQRSARETLTFIYRSAICHRPDTILIWKREPILYTLFYDLRRYEFRFTCGSDKRERPSEERINLSVRRGRGRRVGNPSDVLHAFFYIGLDTSDNQRLVLKLCNTVPQIYAELNRNISSGEGEKGVPDGSLSTVDQSLKMPLKLPGAGKGTIPTRCRRPEKPSTGSTGQNLDPACCDAVALTPSKVD